MTQPQHHQCNNHGQKKGAGHQKRASLLYTNSFGYLAFRRLFSIAAMSFNGRSFLCCVCFLLWFPRVAKQISFHTRPKPSRIHHKFAVTSTSSGIQPPDPVMIISTEASVTNCQCPSLHPRSVATMLQSSTGRRNPPAAACCKQPVSNRACSCKTRPPGFSEI